MARKPVRALRARSSFSVGGIGRVHKGELVADDHPLAKRYPQLFEDVYDVLGIVEQATSNPGQKRSAAKPVESAADVSADEPEEG